MKDILQEEVEKKVIQILKNAAMELESKIQKHEESNRNLEFWISQCKEYEGMYLEQKDISAGYRKIILELQKEISLLQNI